MTGFAAALYQNLPFPVLIVDADARVVSFNEAAGRAFGWNRDGRKPAAEAIIEGAEAAADLSRLASVGRENAHPFAFRHDNGSTFDATAHVLAVPDDESGACYALLLRSLLSGGSHGEQILLGQRVNAALDTMPEGFAVFDRDERLLMFNRTFKDRCGPARENVRVGSTLEALVRANLKAGFYTGIEDGTPEGEALVEARLLDHRTPDSGGTVFPYGGDRWMRSESHVTETGDIVALRVDVTDLKRTEAALEAQATELRRKNEALDQFTATVSHDLKAPLRHLSMFAEMISEDLHRGEFDELPNYADHVRKSAARMRRIIDSLLEFSQIAYRITTPKPVLLSDVVRDALVLLQTHVEESDARIEVGPLPEVLGDPELLKRLAQNLIGNALKYRRPGEAAVVRVYGRNHDGGVDLVVEDDGIGIDAQHVGRIFEVFQRLHRDESVYQGTGVGLALARRIVESHNGVITLDTTYDRGARFVVTFPQPANAKVNDRGRLA
jgi:signal transduction histidine kinase